MVETAACTAASRARDTTQESLMMDLEWRASKIGIQVSVLDRSQGRVRMVPGGWWPMLDSRTKKVAHSKLIDRGGQGKVAGMEATKVLLL
jgi:hypothetical protein